MANYFNDNFINSVKKTNSDLGLEKLLGNKNYTELNTKRIIHPKITDEKSFYNYVIVKFSYIVLKLHDLGKIITTNAFYTLCENNLKAKYENLNNFITEVDKEYSNNRDIVLTLCFLNIDENDLNEYQPNSNNMVNYMTLGNNGQFYYNSNTINIIHACQNNSKDCRSLYVLVHFDKNNVTEDDINKCITDYLKEKKMKNDNLENNIYFCKLFLDFIDYPKKDYGVKTHILQYDNDVDNVKNSFTKALIDTLRANPENLQFLKDCINTANKELKKSPNKKYIYGLNDNIPRYTTTNMPHFSLLMGGSKESDNLISDINSFLTNHNATLSKKSLEKINNLSGIYADIVKDQNLRSILLYSIVNASVYTRLSNNQNNNKLVIDDSIIEALYDSINNMKDEQNNIKNKIFSKINMSLGLH